MSNRIDFSGQDGNAPFCTDTSHMALLSVCDCLDFLKAQDDGTTGLVIADPPYNIGFDGGRGWDRRRPESEWVEWCLEWTRECARVLMPGRMLVVWGTLRGGNQFMRYRIAVDEDPELSALLIPENEIIWSYNWGGRSKRNFARKHEYAWCWRRMGADLLFNADDVRIERKMKVNPRNGKAFSKGTIPTCVWERNNHTTSTDFCGWHPTTKNIDLLQRMIRAWTNKGDLVIDPFSGSGSTAIAALREERRFSGSELDEYYASKSIERIHVLTGCDVDLLA